MRTILVSAYACEPFKGSEQSVGWNIILQLAKNNDVHVVTRANNKSIIDSYLKNNEINNLTFHYYDTPNFFLKLKNKEKGVYLYYILWQIGIIKLSFKLHKQFKFDFAYHVTFGSVWLPTFLFLVPTKFVWGTIGGGEAIPNSFIKTLSLKGRLLQYLRIALIKTIYLNPMVMLPAIKAKSILCRTQNTIDIFPKSIQKKCKILTDGAIEIDVFENKREDDIRDYVQLISTSRLIHTKNVSTIVKAIALLPEDCRIKWMLVGSGPEHDNIHNLVKSLSISEKVEFVESVPREQVLKLLSRADVYIFASLKEACNLSLLEAMAIGLPVICLNWSGMAISTDDSCAIRLEVTNPEQMPKDIADAIMRLVENPDLRRKMGDAGRERIRQVFNWDAKGEFMENLFEELENSKTE